MTIPVLSFIELIFIISEWKFIVCQVDRAKQSFVAQFGFDRQRWTSNECGIVSYTNTMFINIPTAIVSHLLVTPELIWFTIECCNYQVCSGAVNKNTCKHHVCIYERTNVCVSVCLSMFCIFFGMIILYLFFAAL